MKKLFQFLLLVAFIAPFSACKPDEPVEKPQKPYLRFEGGNQKMVANKANTFDLNVISNVAWKAETSVSWLKLNKTEGNGKAIVKVSYEDNTEPKRVGEIRLTAEGVKAVKYSVTQTELRFTNPIGNTPDPWIVKHDGWYYFCYASGKGIKVSRSDKLTVLNYEGAKQVWRCPTGSNVWNPGDVWAPELHYIDGCWYIYYAAGRRPANNNDSYMNQRTGVLRAKTDDPLGEYEDMGMLYTGDDYEEGMKPTVENTNYAIDMGVFYLNGQLYAVWSGVPQKNAAGPQYLYIASMKNPYTISSSRVEISRPDKAWEKRSGTVNEGPAFLRNKEHNKFFVVYSANGSWTDKYCLAYVAMNDTTLNPLETRPGTNIGKNWEKSLLPVFECTDNKTPGVNGVGHCSFTKSPDDTEDWIVYHAKNSPESGWGSGRSTYVKKFTWNDDGTPNFGVAAGYKEEIDLPSGETR